MAREKATYRDNLEQLNVAFPDKQALTVADTASYLGCSRQAVYDNLSHIFKFGRTTKANLARELAV